MSVGTKDLYILDKKSSANNFRIFLLHLAQSPVCHNKQYAWLGESTRTEPAYIIILQNTISNLQPFVAHPVLDVFSTHLVEPTMDLFSMIFSSLPYSQVKI